MKSEAELNEISRKIIGAAIDVHRGLGPGLLESSYQACLAYEMAQRVLKNGIRRFVNQLNYSAASAGSAVK